MIMLLFQITMKLPISSLREVKQLKKIQTKKGIKKNQSYQRRLKKLQIYFNNLSLCIQKIMRGMQPLYLAAETQPSATTILLVSMQGRKISRDRTYTLQNQSELRGSQLNNSRVTQDSHSATLTLGTLCIASI
ncbi:hypothetical protein FGO68_gene8796 [Halteria grandinella]|uniref:Uncharacterized protein n=1 Tax=Halteria grandinella TaxID=5974 RepID=A0A8J8T908_HALGN|nr:hypothetical protein FGO68_gene8796 [Halteria grandinella]